MVLKFGHLTSDSFTESSLQPLAELVAANENVSGTLFVAQSTFDGAAETYIHDRAASTNHGCIAAHTATRLGWQGYAWVCISCRGKSPHSHFLISSFRCHLLPHTGS
jgi:hypothetical protein